MIEKAVQQVDKYKLYIYELNEKHQRRILGEGALENENGTAELALTSISKTSSASSLTRLIDFQIGDQVTRQILGPSEENPLFAGDSVTMSLIDENSQLLDA